MGKLRPSGGYRELLSFQITTIIYDATYWFCEQFIDSRSRTCDQMIQAARSGRQNIAEGSRASATSTQTELRLVNVARSSLEELLLDYEDFLRHRRLPLWEPDSAQATAVRQIGREKHQTNRTDQTDNKNPSDRSDASDSSFTRPIAPNFQTYSHWLDHRNPAIRANAIICLIHQANYLLDKQIRSLEQSFISDGGYSEQLAAARLEHRKQTKASQEPATGGSSSPIPPCPQCGNTMVVRTARLGKDAGNQFFGCSTYPDCKGLVRL